jgi:solute carrier family 13 (sodium-dependent dicarboxylate transporter), member 2/3/5
LIGALLLFMIPVNLKKGTFVMDWSATKGLPWDVLLLFGGGLSLAGAISSNGLAEYLGDLCTGLAFLPTWVLLGVLSFGILMLTELTSNTATAATFLPIVGAIAVSLGRDPLLFLIPTALAANCSYMMPVGTPPNAIVFGSGQIRLPEMARAGFVLNLTLVPIILLMTILIAPSALGMRLSSGSAPEAESGSLRLLPVLPIPDAESMRNNPMEDRPMGEHSMPIQFPVSPHQRWSTSP